MLFAPEDLALVRGDPSVRRRFLDELLVLRMPRLAGTLADYERVLRQRNSLLKSARAARSTAEMSTLDIWNERLVDIGSEIIVARDLLIAELRPEVTAAYLAIAGDDHDAHLSSRLSIVDNPDTERDRETPMSMAATSGLFRDALTRVSRAEIDRAITLVGPHRDDLILELNGMGARSYASHGESWSFALALKLASAQVLRRESTTGDPVLVLDDVFAELDQSRRARLAGAVSGFGQVLITAAVREDVPDELATHTVRITRGMIES